MIKTTKFYFLKKFPYKFNMKDILDKTFFVRLTMILVNISGSVPVTVRVNLKPTAKTGFIVMPKSSRELAHLKFKCFLHSLMTCIQFIHCVIFSNNSTRNDLAKPDQILSWLAFMLNFETTLYLNIGQSKATSLSIFLNNIFQFRDKYISKHLQESNNNYSAADILTLMFIPLAILSGAVYPFCVVIGFHWSTLCKPSLIGSFLLDECNEKKLVSFGIFQSLFNLSLKSFTLGINFYMLFFSSQMILFILNVIHVLSMMSFRENIQFFWNRFKSSSDLYSDALLYRELQIFDSLVNTVQQNCLAVIVVGDICICSIACVFTVMVFNGEITSTFIIIGLLMAAQVDGISVLLLVLGQMVLLHTQSKQVLADIGKLSSSYRNRIDRIWIRRFLKSCKTIRIRFGKANFLEEQTPLRCIDASMNLTVQIMLLTRNK